MVQFPPQLNYFLVTTFGSKMVTTSQGYIFRTFRDQILEFYHFWKFLPGISFLLVWICLDQKLVHSANCPLIIHHNHYLWYCLVVKTVPLVVLERPGSKQKIGVVYKYNNQPSSIFPVKWWYGRLLIACTDSIWSTFLEIRKISPPFVQNHHTLTY